MEPKIWLIDDDPTEHEALAFAFRRTGGSLATEAFCTAEEALDVLEQGERPSLILLDLNMPGRGGFFFLQERRARGFETVPVLIYSSSASAEDVRNSYAQGANAYIEKPVDLDDVTVFADRLRGFWLQAARLPTPNGVRTH